MMSNIFSLAMFRSLRPRQWLKNLALFASIIFTGQLFNQGLFLISVKAFIAFCAVSSASYLFNDVLDAPKDRKHPFKKLRPIASGLVSLPTAVMVSGGLLFLGLAVGFSINTSFLTIMLLFTLSSFVYSLWFKHIAVIDILVIAVGYFLRVYAGEAATGYHLSIWLSLAVFSLSLFLAIGKRRSELTLLQGAGDTKLGDTRTTLGHYSEKLLDTYTSMFANSTWITYAFYTFLERPPASNWMYRRFLWDMFPPDRKWLMATLPFVLFGIMRYMQLIYEGKGESPEKILTSDVPLLSTVILWGLIDILVIYVIGG